ncbi:MAG TPA: prepilin peptidase [Verrucomicrobiae bacterium]|jgi:leader peptidase (prepilin peptidase)/N-methyltransferase
MFHNIFNPEAWALVPFHFWSLCFFAFGCIVGSFLNVCIYRMPLGLSVVSPPSHCPHCKYAIPFYLNIPLVTWLVLNGRCKNCSAPISARYFIVELLTGVLFLSCWLLFGHHSPWLALVYCLFLAGLIVATFIDFEHFIIPDEITYGGAVAGLVISILLPQLHGETTLIGGFKYSALGILFGAGIVYFILRMGKLFFGRQKIPLPAATTIIFTETSLCLPDQEILYEELFYRKTDTIILQAQRVELVDRAYKDVSVRLSPSALQIGDEKIDPDDVAHLEVDCSEIILPREAMGLGDVKFMGAIGAFLGMQGAFFSLMVSSIIGAIVGIILILARKREWSSRMPYGPYIALAAALWVFGGKKIFDVLFP